MHAALYEDHLDVNGNASRHSTVTTTASTISTRPSYQAADLAMRPMPPPLPLSPVSRSFPQLLQPVAAAWCTHDANGDMHASPAVPFTNTSPTNGDVGYTGCCRAMHLCFVYSK